ncbi:hypothetical protein [Methylobacterium sp. WL64]|uniref:hypothetical protein n=1 Tax=Methylobacterium sp. WL64 TaxID=2603894 RepID=UPI00164FF767|nr:hypothetical protein [Methylobacterium sp. WL64]
MIGDDRAGLQVQVRAQDTVADDVELCGGRPGEQEGGFQLRAWADDALRFQPAARAQIGVGRHEAARPDDAMRR